MVWQIAFKFSGISLPRDKNRCRSLGYLSRGHSSRPTPRASAMAACDRRASGVQTAAVADDHWCGELGVDRPHQRAALCFGNRMKIPAQHRPICSARASLRAGVRRSSSMTRRSGSEYVEKASISKPLRSRGNAPLPPVSGLPVVHVLPPR